MNAPPFPLNPQTGEWFQNWVWNGARWVSSPTTGLRVLIQTFPASGPYMPSPGLISCIVECIGGGGGGGPVEGVTTSSVGGGGGGGSGGYAKKILPAALVRGGVLVTVGQGGDGSGHMDLGNRGASGGNTSFGAFCIAYGGQGGQANDGVTYWGQVGVGGAVGVGDVIAAGNPGTPGTSETRDPAMSVINVTSGAGGAGFFGGAGTGFLCGTNNSGNGVPGDGPGSGGGGAATNGIVGVWPGGQGADGAVFVTEYCWGDRDQPDVGWRPPLDVNVSFPRPPWPGGGPWPPGSWWPPGAWWGPGPWPGPGPWGSGRSSVPGPQSREAVEFEAGQPYDQSINPQTGQPWEDEP